MDCIRLSFQCQITISGSFASSSFLDGGEDSFSIRQRVEKTRILQKKRYVKEKGTLNANLKPKQIEKYCRTSGEAKELLKMAIYELGLSARAYDKVLKLGRTIADLAGETEISPQHLAEALQYRSKLFLQ